jgi:HEAT repeat protein
MDRLLNKLAGMTAMARTPGTRNFRVIVGVAAMLLAAAGLLLLIVWPWGPSYQGKSINKWFYAVGNFRSPPDPALDREAFAAMGRDAVPFLVARLEDAPSERMKDWISTAWRTGGEIYRQRKQMWQCRAAYLLGEIGSDAGSAEAALTRVAASGNWAVRGEATVALMKLRRQPLDPLIEKLKDTADWQAWYENAMMVGQFGARAEPAVPILLEALQHSNNIVQAHALIALGLIGRQPDKCIPAIVPFLSSPSISDRQKAITALRGFGTNALVAIAAIRSALTDSDPWVRLQAEIAMKRFGPAAGADPPASPAARSAPR